MLGVRNALWVVLLCAGAFGEDPVTQEGPIAPGQAGYWVKLQGLRASEGSLDPPFTDSNEFTLRVENKEVKSVTLTFELNMQKYDPIEFPKIFVNDKEFKYSPVDVLKYEIPLGETIAPIDQVYRIKIADPAGAVGWPFPHENAHEYTVRVVQAPVFEKVIEAVGISVRSMDGSKIKADKAFDPAERTYHYDVPDGSSSIQLEVLCTPWATGMTVDGVDVALNETQTVAMAHAIKQVNVQCQYSDPRYTTVAQEKTYALKFKRSVHLEDFNVALKISAEQGYCAMRDMEADSGRDGVTGFVCRSEVSEPTFLAIYNNPLVDVVLVSNGTGAQHSLPHGMAVPVKISEKRSRYTLKVLGSAAPWQFPVEVIKAAPCSTLKCGAGKLHRKGLLDVEAAQAHLCLEEVCTAQDEDRCCEDAPRCDTMEDAWCPSGSEPRRDGARCAHDPCSEEDKATCCEKPRPASTTKAPHAGHSHHERSPRLRQRLVDIVRKKVAYYKKLGCSPTPASSCNGEQCFYDETCLEATPRNGGLGCMAAGISRACRFCGFGIYESCPKTYDCEGSCHKWGPKHSAWCHENYGVRCPKALHRLEFWQKQSLTGLSVVTDQIVDALGKASSLRFGTSASLGLLSVVALAAAAVAWRRLASSRPFARWRANEGIQRRILVLEEDEADFIE